MTFPYLQVLHPHPFRHGQDFQRSSPEWSGHEGSIQMLLWGLEQPDLLESFPTHGRGLELNILKSPFQAKFLCGTP